MTVIVAGTFRVPADNLAAARPHMVRMLEASRAEDGCVVYSYAEDFVEPGMIRVFEVWRDAASLAAHAQSGHMATWRGMGPQFGVSDRRLFKYEVGSEQQL